MGEELEDLEEKIQQTKRKKKRSTKLPVDLALCGSGITTTTLGLLRRFKGRKYCTAHRYSAYVTAGLGAVHLYQHKDALIGYVKKSCNDAKDWVEDWVDEKKEEIFGDDGTAA